MQGSVFDEIKWRGLVYDSVPGTQEMLGHQKVTLYNGFDVTADSLHVGHMVPLMALARFQRFGHNPIAVAGGGTTMIGDPSGKSAERKLMPAEEIAANLEAIKPQLARLLDFEVKTNPAQIVNNADWLTKLNLVEFLRDIGKHFSVNYMVAKDSVKTRLAREEGISFTEFAYMLMQAYDFFHLYTEEGCILQTGGSDQWGNITAGVDLIRRKADGSAYALVYPLITKADGTKFGKTEGGTVWLSEKYTSPYHFYQFWLNTDDRDVIPYLKFFTWLDRERIKELEAETKKRPEMRLAQQELASVMTSMIHGETALQRSREAAAVLFGGELTGLTASEVEEIFADVPSVQIPKAKFEGSGYPVLDFLANTTLAKSKADARRLLDSGAIYLNNQRVAESSRSVTLGDAIDGHLIVLRKGKKTFHLVRVG